MEFAGSAIDGLIVPEFMTPEQFYSGARADDLRIRPVKRLMLAVLEDAMRCYQTCGDARSRSRRRLFIEAEAWMFDRKAEGPFAFDTICQTLGIEPDCLRKGLRVWRVQQLNGHNPRPLARRSPVTREGHISAPLRRRRRKTMKVILGAGGNAVPSAAKSTSNTDRALRGVARRSHVLN